jgi:transposase
MTAVSDRPDRFVGVDLHKFTITMVCVDGTRKVVARRRMSNRDTLEIVEFLQSLGPLELTVEATASYDWFVRLVEPYALRVVLAHPGKLRVIAESTRKSDNLDARLLAEMLAMGHIPEAYRPTPRQREHRILVRHRQYLQRKITGAKNKIRRLLSNHNLDRDDLFTKAGQAALANMNLPDSDRFCVDQLVAQWKGFRQQLLATNQQLKAFAESGPREEREDRCLLGSVPGVGVVTTDVILAELAGWRRFSSLKQVSAYAGFVPGQRESAGKRRSLHIEKTGSPLLRFVMVQAAWQLVKRSTRWRLIYERLKGRIGGKKSVIAIARRLLGVCFSVLKSRREYFETLTTAAVA